MKNKFIFISCGSGLEPLLAEELAELGFEGRPGFRGVYVTIQSLEDVYKINYCSRIASRVLLPLLRFRCRDKEDLYHQAREIDWSLYMNVKQQLAIDAHVDHHAFRNSLYAAQVVKDAICDHFRDAVGDRPSVNTYEPDVQFNLFLQKGEGIISLDTSLLPLHKRGYRLESAEASLQENLAASLLRIAKYKEDDILLDPCCGSGTFLIEAAMIATNTPPGFYRKKWGFTSHPDFSQQTWLKIKNEWDSNRKPLPKNLIFGLDINRNAHRISIANLRATGFYPAVSVQSGDFREFIPTIPPNLLVVNPPFGKRLSEEETLIPLYRALGDFMKNKMAKPARGFVLTGSQQLAKEVGLAAKRRYPVSNGGIESRFLEFDIY